MGIRSAPRVRPFAQANRSSTSRWRKVPVSGLSLGWKGEALKKQKENGSSFHYMLP